MIVNQIFERDIYANKKSPKYSINPRVPVKNWLAMFYPNVTKWVNFTHTWRGKQLNTHTHGHFYHHIADF